MATMKLGTSLRFLFPTSPQTHEAFRRALAAAPAGSFIERPMGAYDTAEQARNWLEVAAAARAAGLDGLLVGDNHAVARSEEHTSELQSHVNLVCRLLLEKKKKKRQKLNTTKKKKKKNK